MQFRKYLSSFAHWLSRLVGFTLTVKLTRTSKQLLAYFRTVLDILKHHRTTLEQKNCKRFQDMCEFVGVDVSSGGTQHEHSKN